MNTRTRLRDGDHVAYGNRHWTVTRYRRRAWLLTPLDDVDPYARDVFMRAETARRFLEVGQMRIETQQ